MSMRIIGHGIDLVETTQIARLLSEHPERFIRRCFTEAEAAYAESGRGRRRVERLAGRFAVKEAVLKAMGTGWRNGIAWTDMEIVRDAMGRPDLRLSGQARQLAQDRGINQWRISLSHVETHAIGSAIAISADE